ncbi:MAG TPA: cytochrome P450 [Nakamurella sp.]
MPVPVTVDQLPGPHGIPVLGNLLDLNNPHPIDTLIGWAREFGPIFKLSVPGTTRVIVSGADLLPEICDDDRFDKQLGPGLVAARGTQTPGLFLSETSDPLWRRAHNILMAPFSQSSMRGYLPRMVDIAGQLMDKWSRLNPDDEVNVPQDMTALTLDTIALCGFDYRFNSLYRDTPHPFVAAMVRNLVEAQTQAKELPIQRKLRVQARRRAREDLQFQINLVKGLIEDRRRQGDAADNTDLLGRMLTGVDKQSGEGLPDDNIIAQCLTFLVAGHETTSGLLSFAIHYLMKNPRYIETARRQVDDVLGDSDAPTYEQVHRLTYVRQILDESLRLWPTAPMFTRAPGEDTVIGGKYLLPKGIGVSVLLPMLHRDRSVWGEDAEDFNPGHFDPERFAQVPSLAYRPFGTGLRACIGRQFALQEATLVLGMLLQRFDIIDHRNYQLHTRATLTVKPEDMWIQVRPRVDRPLVHRAPATEPTTAADAAPTPVGNAHGTPLLVLFGSNLGTAEGIANKLGREGGDRGYHVTVAALDDHGTDLPAEGAVLVVCASYNGEPPENAVAFVDKLRSQAAPAGACAGVKFAVFGCGDTDWAATYQAVPTLLDAELTRLGGTRIHPRGAGDAQADFDGQYRAWHADLWTDVAAALGLAAADAGPSPAGPRLTIATVNRQLTNPVIVSYDAMPTLVTRNVELTADGAPGVRSTRHVEVALPAGLTYRAGDHLGVLPRNSLAQIRRAMRRFGLDMGTYVTITANSGTHTHLPVDEPAPLLGVLGSCVELQARATRADIEVLADHTDDAEQQAALRAITADDGRYRSQVREPNLSVLDLLDSHPACRLPFAVFLDLLPALAPRYYSISSSPAASPDAIAVTEGVLASPARSGAGEFNGVCSTYLASMEPGSTVFVFKREPTIPFRPPADPSVPMIMVGAGTGLAPFRGFLQERTAQRVGGATPAPSLLFFGCRTRYDRLYADELANFAESGNVRTYTAFSREPGQERRYAQHEMLARADEIWSLIEDGAVVYVCGNARTLAPGVRAALTQIAADRQVLGGAEADDWLTGLRREHRYLEDIWGAN